MPDPFGIPPRPILAPGDAAATTWTLIPGACPRCRSTGCCYRAGDAIACRFSTYGQIRIHTRDVHGTATYALTNIDENTPDFPNCESEYTADISGRQS